jgi:very-short-patch-repair endonuclease
MTGKVARPDAIAAEIAERQHGVVSARQLQRRGVAHEAIRTRALSGRLHRIHRGVYAVGHAALSPEARWFAAVLALGGDPGGRGDCDLGGEGDSVLNYWGAAVSHRSAACLWDLLPVRDGLADVIVCGDNGRAKRSGIRVHRSLTLVPADVTLRGGIPVTTPARTISDLRLASSLRGPGAIPPRELRRAIRQANVLGFSTDDEGRRDRTRSDLERDFLALCRRHRLPPPEVNVRIGRHLVDFLWRERRLVVETDSYIYHRGRAAFQDDRDRDLELKRLGYEVLRLSERQLNEEPDRVVEVLATVLDCGADDQADGEG